MKLKIILRIHDGKNIHEDNPAINPLHFMRNLKHKKNSTVVP